MYSRVRVVTMKQFLHFALLAALCLPYAVHSQEGADVSSGELVISSGIKDGGYWTIAEKLRAAASLVGLGVRNEFSSGSVSNLRALAAPGNPVSLAFTQADAAAQFLKNNPEHEDSLHLLERIGRECVFIVTDAKSGIKDDEDLQDHEQLSLGIRSPNSGIRVTFEYMATLVPELQDVTMSYGNTAEMLDYLRMPRTDVEAVMFVHGPNEISPEMLRVQANPKDFRFVELTDERFMQMSFRGNPVYEVREITPGLVDDARSFDTICMQGLLVANTRKLSPEQVSALEKLTAEHWDQIHLKESD